MNSGLALCPPPVYSRSALFLFVMSAAQLKLGLLSSIGRSSLMIILAPFSSSFVGTESNLARI